MIVKWWAALFFSYCLGAIVGFIFGYRWDKFSALVNWIANKLRHPSGGNPNERR